MQKIPCAVAHVNQWPGLDPMEFWQSHLFDQQQFRYTSRSRALHTAWLEVGIHKTKTSYAHEQVSGIPWSGYLTT